MRPSRLASAYGASRTNFSRRCRPLPSRFCLSSELSTAHEPQLPQQQRCDAGARRYYRLEGPTSNLSYPSCIAHSGPAVEKSYVICGHPKDWLVSVTDMTQPTKSVKPVVEVSLWEDADIKRRCLLQQRSLSLCLLPLCDRCSLTTHTGSSAAFARRRTPPRISSSRLRSTNSGESSTRQTRCCCPLAL